MHGRKDEVVRLPVNEPTTNEKMGVNSAASRVEEFKFPGSLRAHRSIPDWKERGLFLNAERIQLQPEQEGGISLLSARISSSAANANGAGYCRLGSCF
jgi:hypothetical protein